MSEHRHEHAARVSENAGDGRDEAGRDLTVTIRIGPDGICYFHDLTVDLLPVAVALAPDDPDLAARSAHRPSPSPLPSPDAAP